MLPNPIRTLRIVGFIEGISYLLLLGVAMPLKYLADMPSAVRVVGMAHGVLFIAYVAALVWTASVRKWPIMRSIEGFVASLYPFGTFIFDRKLRREESGELTTTE